MFQVEFEKQHLGERNGVTQIHSIPYMKMVQPDERVIKPIRLQNKLNID